jgi:serine/threonine protein kinase
VSGLCPSCLLELALPAPADPSSDETDDDLLVPETAYRVVTILGADATGTTYLAEQDRTRRLVTLHVVALQPPIDEARRRAFRDRVAALGRLSHPAIQRIIEARRTAAGDGCVVAPYVNGPQLARYCQSPRVDGASLAQIFSTACDAIASAHALGVCHGRLGPDMVIVRPMGDDPAAPVVLGFSVFPAEPPPLDADLRGLEAIARAMGWTGQVPAAWPSIDALRDDVCRGWRT